MFSRHSGKSDVPSRTEGKTTFCAARPFASSERGRLEGHMGIGVRSFWFPCFMIAWLPVFLTRCAQVIGRWLFWCCLFCTAGRPCSVFSIPRHRLDRHPGNRERKTRKRWSIIRRLCVDLHQSLAVASNSSSPSTRSHLLSPLERPRTLERSSGSRVLELPRPANHFGRRVLCSIVLSSLTRRGDVERIKCLILVET